MVPHGIDPQVAKLMAARTTVRHDAPPNLRALRESASAVAGADRAKRSADDSWDDVVPLDGRSLPVRVYPGTPDGCIVLFFHGGGFVKGDLDTHDTQARMLRDVTKRYVVSVHYRLAPEHRFPCAHDDAVDAVRWIGANANALTGHSSGPTRIAVAGTSAGANLAVGAALALAGTPFAPVAQLLAYPLLHGDPTTQSRTDFADGYGLTSQAIEWLVDQYLTHPAQRQDPRFAPALSADLAALPPTVLVGAGLDPLRDDAREFLGRLRAEGVRTLAFEEPTLPHGFWKYAALANTVSEAAIRMCEAFRGLLDDTAGPRAP